MSKLAQDFAKYMIIAKLNANGVVEKPDVIGAIFGQTEGLLGGDLDLRELQRTGRIGRIEVNVKTAKGASTADILIPSSLDSSETSLIAASLETIDKVGPCEATIVVEKVEDVRSKKRQYVVDRATEILKGMLDAGAPDSQKITESIKEAVRTWEVSNYHGLSCGPNIIDSDEIVVVEGRADVINMLKNGIRNVIAIEGSKVPDAIIELTKEKIVTAFLDGDRGGDLNLKKLLAVADIDYVAKAEPGNEVEELTKKQIYKALRDKVPIDHAGEKKLTTKELKTFEKEAKPEEPTEKMNSFLASLLDDLIGTRAAYVVDKNLSILSKVPLSELGNMIDSFTGVYAIVFDGKINQDIVDMALKRKISCIVGMGYKERVMPSTVKIFVMKDLKK
ncbi:MAG: DNA primase DnaG [Candidatus Aenigmarchaeota archaeon]|nr:DNA primase DnaG [Candidatus Aenigmarchaeota archaeon]